MSLASGCHLNVLEHVRMVADLLQLHDGVHQGLGSSFALRKIIKKKCIHQSKPKAQ